MTITMQIIGKACETDSNEIHAKNVTFVNGRNFDTANRGNVCTEFHIAQHFHFTVNNKLDANVHAVHNANNVCCYATIIPIDKRQKSSIRLNDTTNSVLFRACFTPPLLSAFLLLHALLRSFTLFRALIFAS